MEGVLLHELGAGHEHQVRRREVPLVAVLEDDGVAGRDRPAVRLLPGQVVDEFPIVVVVAAHVGHLSHQVAVLGHGLGPDGAPGVERLSALLEPTLL